MKHFNNTSNHIWKLWMAIRISQGGGWKWQAICSGKLGWTILKPTDAKKLLGTVYTGALAFVFAYWKFLSSVWSLTTFSLQQSSFLEVLAVLAWRSFTASDLCTCFLPSLCMWTFASTSLPWRGVLNPIFNPTEQANPTSVFRENTISKNAAFICMDLFPFIFFHKTNTEVFP